MRQVLPSVSTFRLMFRARRSVGGQCPFRLSADPPDPCQAVGLSEFPSNQIQRHRDSQAPKSLLAAGCGAHGADIAAEHAADLHAKKKSVKERCDDVDMN